MWVVNPRYVRRDLVRLHNAIVDHETYARDAKERMDAMDALPKSVRLTIHEYGQLHAALCSTAKRASGKTQAVKKAYLTRLYNTATFIGD